MNTFVQNSLRCGLLIAVLTAVSMAPPCFSQERQTYPEGTVRIVLVDRSTVVGTIESEDDDEVVVRTSGGVVMTIPRDQIKSIESLGGERFHRIDPNRTRLFFAPTGRAVGAGRGYVSFYEIIVPFVAVGATNSITLAGGVTLNPGSSRVLYAAPKVTVLESRTRSVAIGGIGAMSIGEDDGNSAGLLFAVGTFGPPRASVTTGFAFGFVNGEFGNHPTLLVGGQLQISNNFKLLTENYVFLGTDAGVLVSGGVRFFGDRLAADIGLVTLTSVIDDAGGFPFVPWLGFTYNFGD